MEVDRISRRQFLKVGAGVAGMAVLAACAPAAAPAGAPASEGGEPAVPAQEAVTLRLTFWGDLADMPTWDWGLGQFSETHPEINIRWENTPWGEFWTKLQTEMAAGTPPDVTGMVSMYAQQYIRQGSLLSLQPFVEREPDVDLDDFWPAIMPAYQLEGETYAFPYDLSTMLLMYNKKLFDEAEVPYPVAEWTWDEFQDACLKLTKDVDDDGRIDQWAYLLPTFDWNIDAWLSTNRAHFLNEEGTVCTADTPEAIETIQFLADLRNVHRVSPTPGEAGDIPLFETGRAAITWGNTEFVQNLVMRVGPPRDNDNFLWDVALIPKKLQDGNGLAGGSFSITRGTTHQEEAWTFVKFYTSAPILEEMVGRPSRGVPGRMSIADSLITDENPEHQQYFLDVLDYPSLQVMAIPAYEQAMAIKNKHLDPVFLGQASVAEACPALAAELTPILEATAEGV